MGKEEETAKEGGGRQVLGYVEEGWKNNGSGRRGKREVEGRRKWKGSS